MSGLVYHIIFIFLNQVEAMSVVLWGAPKTEEMDFTAFICIKLKSRDSVKTLWNACLAKIVLQKQRHSEWSRQRHKLLLTIPLLRRRSSYLYQIFRWAQYLPVKRVTRSPGLACSTRWSPTTQRCLPSGPSATGNSLPTYNRLISIGGDFLSRGPTHNEAWNMNISSGGD